LLHLLWRLVADFIAEALNYQREASPGFFESLPGHPPLGAFALTLTLALHLQHHAAHTSA